MGITTGSLCLACTAFIAVVASVAAMVYLLGPSRTVNIFGPNDPLTDRLKCLLARRRFAAVMIIVIAIMFLLGISLMERPAGPDWFYFWAVLLLMLLWLVALTMLDVFEVGAICRTITNRSEQRLVQILQVMKNSQTTDSQTQDHARSVSTDEFETLEM